MKYIAIVFLLVSLKGFGQESKHDLLRVSVEVDPSFAYYAKFELFQQDESYQLNYMTGKDTLIQKGLIRDTSQVKAITDLLFLMESAHLKKLTSEDWTDGTLISGFIRRTSGETPYFKSHSGNLAQDPVQKQLVQLCFKLALTYLQTELQAKRQLSRAVIGIQENLVVMRLKETEEQTIH